MFLSYSANQNPRKTAKHLNDFSSFIADVGLPDFEQYLIAVFSNRYIILSTIDFEIAFWKVVCLLNRSLIA